MPACRYRAPLHRTLLLCLALLASATAVAETAAPPLKFHPGHYAALNRGDDAGILQALLQTGIRGIQKRYTWAQLETAPNRYDFSAIEADLAAASGLGLQLVAFIEDKSFTGEKPTPAYLHDGFTLAHHDDRGWIAKRWDPFVVERFARLLSALGARFDPHPGFEGIALQESALSLSALTLRTQDYSARAYRDALVDTLLAARRAMPHSQVFWYMNFLPGGQVLLVDIARTVAPYRIAMGGPDVLPDQTALRKLSYPIYRRFQGDMTLFGSMQFASYSHPRADGADGERYWSMEELFLFARDELRVDYLFWNRKHWQRPEGSRDWNDALAVIRKHPRFNASEQY
jgi:hypothetical protein